MAKIPSVKFLTKNRIKNKIDEIETSPRYGDETEREMYDRDDKVDRLYNVLEKRHSKKPPDDDPDVNMFGEIPGGLDEMPKKKKGGKVQTKFAGGRSIKRMDRKARA